MTKLSILFIGNSQLASLMSVSYRHFIPNHKVSFFAIPGGTGPAAYLDNHVVRIISGAENPKFPAFTHPKDGISLNVLDYDCIFISALGLFDYPAEPKSSLVGQGFASHFDVLANSSYQPITSDLFTIIAKNFFLSQRGFQFLDILRKSYSRKIFVQRFPRVSIEVMKSNQWTCNLYSNPCLAYAFFSELRDSFLREFCDNLDVTILPEPDALTQDGLFTRKEFMSSDLIHPNEGYASLVWQDITLALQLFNA